MTWLFERTIECAAWVAMIVAWAAAAAAVYWLVRWFGTIQTGADYELLKHCLNAAAVSVAFSLALGALACIDRFIFDADEVAKK